MLYIMTGGVFGANDKKDDTWSVSDRSDDVFGKLVLQFTNYCLWDCSYLPIHYCSCTGECYVGKISDDKVVLLNSSLCSVCLRSNEATNWFALLLLVLSLSLTLLAVIELTGNYDI